MTPDFDADFGLWHGPPATHEELKLEYGVDSVITESQVGKFVKGNTVHVLEGTDLVLVKPAGEIRTDLLKTAITESRVLKTKTELALLQRVCKISSQAHMNLMKSAVSKFKTERDLEALFAFDTGMLGGMGQAYTPIIATHTNGAILHYNSNDADIVIESCVLVDAGCELYCYGTRDFFFLSLRPLLTGISKHPAASDITRTWPRNGKFNSYWKTVYEIVLQANKAVIAALKPEVEWETMHRLSARIIGEGLIKAKLVIGTIEDILEKHIVALFYPHGLGHSLGLDVHDCGGYPAGVERIQEPGIRYLRMRRTLKEGMVVTVEPGLYFVEGILRPAFTDAAQSKLLNIPLIEEYMTNVGGVRIEDDVYISKTGCSVLSSSCPKELADVESICMSGQK